MSGPSPRPDLTRFNRSGLARVNYVDGNAATWLERLRDHLARRFPEWHAVQAQVQAGDSVAEERRLLAQYLDHPTGRDDMLWQITRSFARAAHVLTGTLDAYANEGWIGTATQWESLRRLVAMLDYAPHPAASAYTPVALHYKPGKRGTIAPGLQLRHLPADGGAPVLFETLEPQRGDWTLNELRVAGHDRNPLPFAGACLHLQGKHEKIRAGDAVVLEDERDGRYSAHRVQAVTVDAASTRVVFDPPVMHAEAYTRGWLRVHAAPKEALGVHGPLTDGSVAGRALQLATPTEGLAAGDIVVIGRPGGKPLYRRIKRVDADARCLVFHQPLGAIDLLRSTISRPVQVPISRREDVRATHDGTQLRFLRVTGDWRRLQGLWLGDLRVVRGREYFPRYQCIRAEYTPVLDGKDSREGYTVLGLAWHAQTDGVTVGGAEPALELLNPQTLLAPPPSPGAWRPDSYLQQSADGGLREPIVSETARHIRAGDFAVLLRGGALAGVRLASVAVDEQAARAHLSSREGWRRTAQTRSVLFHLGDTRLQGHFQVQARVQDWDINATPLSGATTLPLETLPASLRRGQPVLVSTPSAALRTWVRDVSQATATVILRDPLPKGSTAANLRLHGNVVMAGHGETRSPRILGSGDATRSQQSFVFDARHVSFVADATLPAGVRADVQLHAGEERWTQVGNLNDSAPTDAHYQVRVREDGLLTFVFGDAVHARRLPTGINNLRVHWRQGVGVDGNLPANALTELVHPHALLSGFAQPVAAAGGGERESIASLRDNAAASILAMERAVSLEDFARLLRSHAAVAQARAVPARVGYARQDRIEVYVVPAGGAAFTPELAAQLHDYLARHAAAGLAVTVRPYAPVSFRLRVSVRVRREAFDPDTVRDRVRAALIDGFGIDRRGLGQPLYRGELLAMLDQVEGVENSTGFIDLPADQAAALRHVARSADGTVLAALPFPTQCVHLPFQNPTVDVDVEDYTL